MSIISDKQIETSTTQIKGSDGENTAELTASLGAEQKANERASITLSMLSEGSDSVDIFTVAGDMGETLCQQLGFAHSIVYTPSSKVTTFEDTERAAKAMAELNLDLILFAGGDGTARCLRNYTKSGRACLTNASQW